MIHKYYYCSTRDKKIYNLFNYINNHVTYFMIRLIDEKMVQKCVKNILLLFLFLLIKITEIIASVKAILESILILG